VSAWRKIERALRPYVIPNLTLVLIVGQVTMFVLGVLNPEFAQKITLQPQLVLAGEWWRMFTFIFVPTTTVPIFLLMGLLFLHMIGNALEGYLGTVKYNLFILTSVLTTIGSALLVGIFAPTTQFIGNEHVYGSLFLAFAWLYPDVQLLVMFILPVKIKWLALITVFFYVVELSNALGNLNGGGWLICVTILAANLNLLIFFGQDFYGYFRSNQRRMVGQVKQFQESKKPRHVCVVCGANNLTHPEHDFRYCPDCAGTPAYCQEHLRGHVHITQNAANTRTPI
jgi:hypothetical protein